MLTVFFVIFEYRLGGRNSSDRPTVSVLHVHSALWSFKANPDTFIFKSYQLQLITEHAFRGAQMLN